MLIDGLLQQQDGVTSVRAERVTSLRPSPAADGADAAAVENVLPVVASHDFR